MAGREAPVGRTGGYLVGRLRDAEGGRLKRPLEVAVYDRGSERTRVGVDGAGRFLVRFDRDLAAGSVLDVVVTMSGKGDGYRDELARHRVSVPAPGSVIEAEFAVRSGPPTPDRGRRLDDLPPVRRDDADLVQGQWRIAMAKLLVDRQPTRKGVPVVPPRINDHIARLHELRSVARRILQGDLRSADRYEKLVGFAPKTAGSGAGASIRSTTGETAGPTAPGTGDGAGNVPGTADMPSIAGMASLADEAAMARIDGAGPCIFHDRGAIEVALAGLYLDAYRAESLGDLTQPGASAQHGVRVLHTAHAELSRFGQAVRDLADGRMSTSTYEKIVYGRSGPGDAEPIDLPDDGTGFGGRTPGPTDDRAPGPNGASGSIATTPLPEGSLPPGMGAGPCLDLWIDCVDHISDFAAGYQPPRLCSSEETIDSITPSAVCAGDRDVELVLRPVEGERFQGDGVSCRVVLQRGRHRTELAVERFTADEVRVVLAEAVRSGCIGFVGTGGGSSGASPGVIRSCMRLAGIHNRALEGLLTPGISSLRAIRCLSSGANTFRVVGPPRLAALSASWDGGTVESTGDGSATLVAEACRDVTLAWDADFGPAEEDWLDPNEFITVEITDGDGAVVASGQPPSGSIVVTESQADTYKVTATASVGGSACSATVDSIEVDRFHALHLSGIDELRTGTSGELALASSCPAPAGGIPVAITASPSGRLTFDPQVVIPEGQTSVTLALTATGAGCEKVIVAAQAADHLPTSVFVDVFDVPVLDSVNPSPIPACTTVDIELTGACFAPGDTTVRATRFDGAIETLPVLQVTPTTITARAEDLRPGRHDFRVRSRGLASEIVPINAIAGPPIVDLFVVNLVGQLVDGDIVANDEFIPCAANIFEVTYTVSNTTGVRVLLDGDVMEDVPGDDCGETLSGQFPFLESEGGVLRLEASRVNGGTPLREERQVGGKGSDRLNLHNSTSLELVVWNISGLYQNAADIPHSSPKQNLPPDGDIQVSFSDCILHHVVAIDKQAAIDAGRDPDGDAIEIGSLRQFESLFVGDTDGETMEITLLQ